jgi:hypothetical protein
MHTTNRAHDWREQVLCDVNVTTLFDLVIMMIKILTWWCSTYCMICAIDILIMYAFHFVEYFIVCTHERLNSWQFVCVCVGCGYPPTVSRAITTQWYTNVGDTIYYTCDSGYNVHGTASITCQSPDIWTAPPTCTGNTHIALIQHIVLIVHAHASTLACTHSRMHTSHNVCMSGCDCSEYRN